MKHVLRIEASDLYRCISDAQRLRILNLLEVGPLCVCHLQEILAAPQVKISKLLASMKQLGLIDAQREGTWMIYQLTTPASGLLLNNLEYLRQAACADCSQLQRDLEQRTQLLTRLQQPQGKCPDKVCEQLDCC
jgi:ArsR family transcriptional regulator